MENAIFHLSWPFPEMMFLVDLCVVLAVCSSLFVGSAAQPAPAPASAPFDEELCRGRELNNDCAACVEAHPLCSWCAKTLTGPDEFNPPLNRTLTSRSCGGTRSRVGTLDGCANGGVMGKEADEVNVFYVTDGAVADCPYVDRANVPRKEKPATARPDDDKDALVPAPSAAATLVVGHLTLLSLSGTILHFF